MEIEVCVGCELVSFVKVVLILNCGTSTVEPCKVVVVLAERVVVVVVKLVVAVASAEPKVAKVMKVK